MRSRNISNLILIILTILLQAVMYRLSGASRAFPFCTEYRLGRMDGGFFDSVFMIYLPLAFVLFHFTGIKDYAAIGFGSLVLIRSGNCRRLIKWMVMIVISEMALVETAQCIFSGALTIGRMNIRESIIAVLMYYLGLVLLAFIMVLLELIFTEKLAYIIINILLVISLFAGSAITSWDENIIFFCFDPILLMLYGSSISSVEGATISKALELILIQIVYIITTLVVTMIVFEKKDILEDVDV